MGKDDIMNANLIIPDMVKLKWMIRQKIDNYTRNLELHISSLSQASVKHTTWSCKVHVNKLKTICVLVKKNFILIKGLITEVGGSYDSLEVKSCFGWQPFSTDGQWWLGLRQSPTLYSKKNIWTWNINIIRRNNNLHYLLYNMNMLSNIRFWM